KLREFKKGSLKLATMAKAPVVPVSIDGAYRAYEIDRKFKSIDITVTFGKPIYTENLTREEEKGLMEKVREVISKNLGQ
ncbi:lysophospholipid acyltransferase family protein, partial [Clostridium tertium]|nr:1-acyl-sn-glycerol-3-phosphate acyltransferase [Clostridium tertium]